MEGHESHEEGLTAVGSEATAKYLPSVPLGHWLLKPKSPGSIARE